jgi:hypothetical protein
MPRYEVIIGVHGLKDWSNNGEIFANICALYGMVIGGTDFPHKNIHKGTWVSPDHVTVNQIDHICINRKFRCSLTDVRAIRGADVFSDHHLVVAKLRLKLKRNLKNEARRKPKFNVNYLKDLKVNQHYSLTLSNKYQVLQDLIQEDEETSIHDNRTNIKETLNQTCGEILGRQKTKHKEWISEESYRKIERKDRKEKKAAVIQCRTRGAKAIVEEQYMLANKEV